MTSTVADSGFIYAILDTDDSYHNAALTLINDKRWRFLVPGVTLVEVFKLMVDRKHYGPQERQHRIKLFAQGLRDITEQMPFDFEDSTPSDFRRVSGILDTYADSNIDYVDAVVIAIAERFGTRFIMTVDQTDFRRYVNSSGEHFILPIFDS